MICSSNNTDEFRAVLNFEEPTPVSPDTHNQFIWLKVERLVILENHTILLFRIVRVTIRSRFATDLHTL